MARWIGTIAAEDVDRCFKKVDLLTKQGKIKTNWLIFFQEPVLEKPWTFVLRDRAFGRMVNGEKDIHFLELKLDTPTPDLQTAAASTTTRWVSIRLADGDNGEYYQYLVDTSGIQTEYGYQQVNVRRDADGIPMVSWTTFRREMAEGARKISNFYLSCGKDRSQKRKRQGLEGWLDEGEVAEGEEAPARKLAFKNIECTCDLVDDQFGMMPGWRDPDSAEGHHYWCSKRVWQRGQVLVSRIVLEGISRPQERIRLLELTSTNSLAKRTG